MRDEDASNRDPISIRLAHMDDVESLSEIEARAGALFREIGMSEIAAGETLPRKDLAAGVIERRLWVAEAGGGELAGFALVIQLDGGPHLEEISVHPRFGRRGLGARILEAVVGELADRGHRRVSLSTFLHVPWNAPFYRKHGFLELSEHAYSQEFVELRRHEAVAGLAVDQRVIMCRDLDRERD
jgi:GNAT superfamily N-acetyltransferase